jgi:serine/threonine protein kinase
LKDLIEENKAIDHEKIKAIDHEEIYKLSKHVIYGLDYLNQINIIHKDINPRYF